MGVFTEIPPLSNQDSFVVFERKKKAFDFPIHVHKEFELNLIRGAEGATRVIGDSISTIGDLELVLVGGGNLEHGWMNGDLKGDKEFREITLQFSPDLFSKSDGLFSRRQFFHIMSMLDQAKNGISFSEDTAEKVSSLLDGLIGCQDRFQSVLMFLHILNVLAMDPSLKILSSFQPDRVSQVYDGENIQKTMDYLQAHFKEKIKLEDIADHLNMSPSTFCRFLKKRTGKNFSDNIIDIRIAIAAKNLIAQPEATVAEIAYRSGFKNLSNFNRQFKSRKGLTPLEFRNYYIKNKIII